MMRFCQERVLVPFIVPHMKTDTIVDENPLISFDVTMRERGIIHRQAFIARGADSITWIFDCDAP